MNILDFMVINGLAKSKSDARRLIKQGAVKVIRDKKEIIIKDTTLDV